MNLLNIFFLFTCQDNLKSPKGFRVLPLLAAIPLSGFAVNRVHSADLSIPNAAKLSAASIVKIYGAAASGSGVAVEIPDEGGTGTKKLLVTAYHVVSSLGENESIGIELPNGDAIEIPSSSIKKVSGHDLAFITLPNNYSKSFKTVSIGNSNLMNLGDQVIIAGFPLAKSSNVSNRVRIKAGLIQTFSTKPKNTSYVGYDAETVPGMSGGGVFSMDGKLMLIHLMGEKDLRQNELPVDTLPLKSGTNYGISALLALRESQKDAMTGFKANSPVDVFRKGLYLVHNNKINDAYNIFHGLEKKYPDSLIAEWNAACMKLQITYPNGPPSMDNEKFPYRTYMAWSSQESQKTEEFVQKHGVKPFYGFPFTSDSHVWDEKDRFSLLASDPIYALAKQPNSDAESWMFNRGSLIQFRGLGSERRCERIVGLKKNQDRFHWASIPNPSD